MTPTGHRPAGPLSGQIQPWAGPAVAGDCVRAVWEIMVITVQFDGILWSSIALPWLASYCQTCCELALKKKWKGRTFGSIFEYLGEGGNFTGKIYCWLFFVCSSKIICVWGDFLRKDSLDLILHRFVCKYKIQSCVNILWVQFLGLWCPH